MTNNAYIRQLDPIQGLIDYVEDIKPYHTKIIEVMIEYVYDDKTASTVRDAVEFAWGPSKFPATVGPFSTSSGSELLAEFNGTNSLSGLNPTFTASLDVPAGTDRALVGFYSITNQTFGTTLPHTVLVDGQPTQVQTYTFEGGDATPVTFGIFSYPLGDSLVETTHSWTVQITSAAGLRTRTYQVRAFSGINQADAASWFDYDFNLNANFDEQPGPVAVAPSAAGDLVFTGCGQFRSGPATLSLADTDYTVGTSQSPTFGALNTAYSLIVADPQTIQWSSNNQWPSVAAAIVLRSTGSGGTSGPTGYCVSPLTEQDFYMAGDFTNAFVIGDVVTLSVDGSPVLSQEGVVTAVCYDAGVTVVTVGGSSPLPVLTSDVTHVLIPGDVTHYFAFDVTEIDDEEQTITVSGPATADIFNGQQITVTGTSFNDGVYTVQGSPTFNGLSTIFPVAEPLLFEVIGISPTPTITPVRYYIP